MDMLDRLKPIGDLFESGKLPEALKGLERMWKSFPVPQEAVKNSYSVVSYGAIIAMKAGDLEVAKIWADRGLANSGIFNLVGESEFLCGEVAFARGEMEAAAIYFKKVRKNSGKRQFKGKDPRYLKLTE